jgi:hypothetical protein
MRSLSTRSLSLIVLSLVSLAVVVPADADPPKLPKPSASTVLGLLSAGSPDALAGSIRGYLVQNLPSPIYEARPNWGHTANPHGLKAIGPGSHTPVNDGKWKHIVVTAINPADNLVFDVRNLNQSEPGRITFDVFLAFNAHLDYDQQNWRNGTRVWSGGARARFRVKANLACETTFRVDTSSSILPDVVVRFHVVRSNVAVEQFVMEHINGVGGELAELFGNAMHHGLNHLHPSLEHDMLEKANAAIEKAADTKEVHVSMSELLKKKGWWPTDGGAKPRRSPAESANPSEPPPASLLPPVSSPAPPPPPEPPPSPPGP